MMSVSRRVTNDQYEETDNNNINESDEEEIPLRTVVQEIERTHILLLTPMWKEVLYETTYELGTQYYYIMYNKNTEPKYYVREIRLDLYQDQECAKGPDIYAHQINSDGNTQNISIPTRVRQRVWEESVPDPRLGMIREGETMILRHLVDEREDKDFISASFKCTNTRYELFLEEHYHVYNVDPEYPNIPLREGSFSTMINCGFIYDWQRCEWRSELHVHFLKNE